MKLILLGDIHGQWKETETIINAFPPESVFLQLGDFGYDPHQKYSDSSGNWDTGDGILLPNWNLKHPLFWIDGNHEDHDSIPCEMRETSHGVTYVPRGTVMNFEMNVLCIGGADTVSWDRHHRTIGRTWFPEKEGLKEDDARRILDRLSVPIDVVVSHAAPLSFAVPDIKPDVGCEDTRIALDIILRNLLPTQWFFGHYHLSAEGVTRSGCHWQALGIAETKCLG